MHIVSQSAPFSLTQPPYPLVFTPQYPLLPAPPKRLCLPAPKIAGLLPAVCGGRIHGFAPTEIVDGIEIDGQGHRPAPTQDSGLATQDSSLSFSQPSRRVVTPTIVNAHILIADPRERWAEFERVYGPERNREAMDAELDAIIPGYTAYMREKIAQLEMQKAPQSPNPKREMAVIP